MTGGLFDPLGTDRADLQPVVSRPPAIVLAAGLVLAALAALLAVSWWHDDGDRGRPVAVAPIEHVEAPPKPTAAPSVPTATAGPPSSAPQAAAPAPAASGGPPPARGDQDIEIQNGVRIVRPHRDGPGPGSQTIRVPDAKAPR